MLADYRNKNEEYALEFLPITQTSWGEWVEENPDTRVLDPDTGYDHDYDFYRDYQGFIKRHYWENPNVTHPGVTDSDDDLSGQTYVYGIESDDGVHVYPVEAVREHEPLTDTINGRDVVVVMESGDVGVYESPGIPVERAGDELVDPGEKRWAIRHDALHTDEKTNERIAGRHGLWLSFRPHYNEYVVVDG